METVYGKEISLFKVNRVMILNEAISVDKSNKPWMVGIYLQMLKNSAATVKIGVGYIKTEVVIDLSKEQVCLLNQGGEQPCNCEICKHQTLYAYGTCLVCHNIAQILTE